MLTLTEVAKRTGLSADTLRYYERIGLIDPVPRRHGRRVYRDEDLRWIEFLLRLRATGMPIRAMQDYAQWRREGGTAASLTARRALLTGQAGQVAAQLAELSRTLAMLQDKIAYYDRLEQAASRVPESNSQKGASDAAVSEPILHSQLDSTPGDTGR